LEVEEGLLLVEGVEGVLLRLQVVVELLLVVVVVEYLLLMVHLLNSLKFQLSWSVPRF